MSSDHRSDLARVRGAGASHHGAGLWIKERVSSLALAPLTVWGLWAAWSLAGAGSEGALAFLRAPLNAGLLVVVVVAAIYHMHLGMRVIIEDYFHKPLNKGLFLLLNMFACLGLALAGVLAILKIVFLGGAGV